MYRNWALALAFGISAVAGAQSRSSFIDVSHMTDVFVTESNGGLTWEVALGAAPTLEYNSVTYHITDLFGFWVLDDNNDLSASALTQNGWSFNSSTAGTGGIFGWKTNPNNGITPGSGPLTFNFTSATGQHENVGFHMRFDSNFANTGGNTVHVAAVPGPAPLIPYLAGLGALFLRRAKKNSS